jgi:O-antigen/teichoic acid export membrane protein|uniref:oligosaccharide flippase family protein n=1 Tax=Bacteroides eggerthii TaxID=28111 RepID=UPI003FEEA927
MTEEISKRYKPISIKRNFTYKSLLTLSTYLMSLVTFPYVSRVLGVERIGLVNFIDNTISYFLLFSSLGIGLLGVREIASVKDNPKELSRVYSDLLGMNSFFSILTIIAYCICIAFIPRFIEYSELFYIGIAKIVFTTFLVEWFFTGIEQFKYITIRSVIVKIVYVLLVFLLVDNPEDFFLYFMLTTGVVVVNSLIDITYVRHFVCIQWREFIRFRFLKQNIILGIYTLMNSMYLTFNVMYLGLVSDNIQVGYYTTAYKFYMIILGIFSAFTQVMLPRMSTLFSQGDLKNFHILVNKSFNIIFTFGIPLILCGEILAPQIIFILSGNGYEGAILPMRIIMPAILFVGVAQVLAIQILMPMKADRFLLFASFFGAFFALILNILIVPYLKGVGTGIVLVISEFVVTIFYIIILFYKRIISFPFSLFIDNLFCSLPSVCMCLVCINYIVNPFLLFITASVSGAICWLITAYYMKNEFVILLVKRILKRYY